jgi:hypothetical protein
MLHAPKASAGKIGFLKVSFLARLVGGSDKGG